MHLQKEAIDYLISEFGPKHVFLVAEDELEPSANLAFLSHMYRWNFVDNSVFESNGSYQARAIAKFGLNLKASMANPKKNMSDVKKVLEKSTSVLISCDDL